MEEITELIKSTVEKLFSIKIEPELSVPEEKFGDYATNVALVLAKQVGERPVDIAQKIIDKLSSNSDFSFSIAGPGFINIKISDRVIANALSQDLYESDLYKNKTVVCEFSDPNPFKVLHVGHLYTSIVGDSIARLIEAAGGNVHRVNFGGDVGLHVAKNVWAIINHLGGEHPEKLAAIPEKDRSDWLAACYVKGNSAYEDNDAAKAEIISINKSIYKITRDDDHESPLAQIYWTCRQWSYDYFDNFYDYIGVKFEKYYPESDGAKVGLPIVQEQLRKGVYKESDGAIVFIGEPYGLHTRVFVNSEGIPTYETKDLGANFQKWHDYNFDQSIILTDNGQTDYMKVVLKSIEQFKPEISNRTLHLTHGIVKLAGGVRMSSRSGNFLKAVDAIKMTEQALAIEQNKADKNLVMSAIKYTFLKNNLGPDMVFDPETSVALHGNSGPYLQYAGVRAKSILQKLGSAGNSFSDVKFDANERGLAIKLIRYGEVADQAVRELAPHRICTYLYELTTAFNKFYEVSKVDGDPRQNLRASLVSKYVQILDQCLWLLGIPTVEKM